MESPTKQTNTADFKGKSMPKPNNMFVIPVGLEADFFKWWCIFLRPFVNLTPKEIDVVSSFLRQRHLLLVKKNITDPAILDEMVMSESTKKKVIEESKITLQHFYVIMSTLRKNNIIVDGKLNSSIIPNIRETDNGVFRLLIKFENKT